MVASAGRVKPFTRTHRVTDNRASDLMLSRGPGIRITTVTPSLRMCRSSLGTVVVNAPALDCTMGEQ